MTFPPRLRAFLERYAKTDLAYFASSAFWLNLNSVGGALFSFVLSILFAHFLSKETYGVYRYILSVAGIASAFSLSGMNVAVMRSAAQGFDGIFKRSIVEQFKWSWPQALFSFAASGYYAWHANWVYAGAFLIVALLAPASSIANTFNAILYGKKDFKRSAYYGLMSNGAYFAFMAAAIVWASSWVLALIAVYYAVNTAANAYFCRRTYRLYRLGEVAQDYRPGDISYAKHLSLMNIIGTVANQADSLIVYYLLGPVSLALYSFAILIPERIRTMFGFIASAAFPKIAEKDPADVRENLGRKTWQLVILALAISLVYIVAAPLMFKIFFPQYEGVVLYSQIFSLALVAIATNISFTALLAQRQQKELYAVSIGVPLIKIAASVIGIYLFGIWGAIGAKMLNNLLLLASTSYYAAKKP